MSLNKNIIFSNLQIIHDENTREITTVTEVLISCLYLHRFFFDFIPSPVFSAFNDQFEKLYQTLKTVFDQVFKHLVEPSSRCVWISDETLFLVFDILHQTCILE